MTASWRTTTLAERHRALGSGLEDWIGMPTAWTYDADVAASHVAIRTRAGLMDVSGLRKVHLVGPHASAVVDYVTTRDVNKITPGRSAYATMLDDDGKFIDDCVLFRTGPTSWLVVHGGGQGHESLVRQATGRNVAMIFDDDLHDLSLQGPVAVELLARHVPGIRDLRYFHHVQTTLFGRAVMISRTGYTGERGYEIFCAGRDAPVLWDALLESGADLGVVPAAFTALDMLRVESGLLFYPFDNSETFPFADESAGDTLWELGLDFTVSPGKTGFRGADAHYRAKGAERFRIFGLALEGTSVAQPGDIVTSGGRAVGVTTMGMFSSLTQKSMALARLAVDSAVHGTPLEVMTDSQTVPALAHTLPFDDPKKTKRTAVG